MNKILLVYEDYADLMAVEGTLKKVGFDVIGLSSEYAIAEQMLAFNPDLVVGSGRGGKVNSLGVGKRLKEMTRWQGKSVLIFPANFKPNPQELIRIRVDMILEAPVPPLRLVQVIGKILGHDEAILLERLNKSMHVESPQKTSSTVGGPKHSPEGEAIYVKGIVEGENPESEESSLDPERVQVDSQEFTLNTEEQGKKVSFRFGDRMSSAGAEAETTSDAEGAFPDVDLKALERELLGGGAPEVERVETINGDLLQPADSVEVSEVGEDEEAAVQTKAREELEKSEKTLKDRIAKYSGMVADVKVSPKSTVTRVEARRRQKQLEADWDEQNLNELDKLRREFTKALFKK
ncbi:hypothetical protein [Bdellovibrio bacteriovorus]|uniref:hypothetical protein n=1 Tax=Bdellovibrio TaxID=958 RepID=UPI0035A8E7B3